MKRILFFLVICSTALFAQFKDQANGRGSVRDGLISSNTSSTVLGFINPNNFKMKHSYSMSYSAFGGNGLAMGIYTNSMAYKFNDKLNLQVDASLVHTPYSTFNRSLTDQMNGIFISRAELNYKPSEDFLINIQYNRSPYGYYDSPYGYGYGGWGNYGMYNGMYNQSRFSNDWLYGK